MVWGIKVKIRKEEEADPPQALIPHQLIIDTVRVNNKI